MTDTGVKIQASIVELEHQRDWALTRCVAMAAEMAELRHKIAALEKKKEPDAAP